VRTLLYEAANVRFYGLSDKISHEDILAHAYARRRANKVAPGLDRQDFDDIDAYEVGGVRLLRRGRLQPIGRICNLGRSLRSGRLIVLGMQPGCVSRGGRPCGLHAILEHDLLRA
jgi:hypothetical protein